MSAGTVCRIVVGPDPAESGDTLQVTADEGAKFLSGIDHLPFTGLVWPIQRVPIFAPLPNANAERVKVTGVEGDVLTFIRSDNPVPILAGMQIAVLATMPDYDLGAIATLVSAATALDFTLVVRDPAGVVTTTDVGGTASYPLTLSKSGIWNYRWEADGVPQTEQQLFARYSEVLP